MTEASHLLVPADRTEDMAAALAGAAHAVVLDMDESVAPSAKFMARGTLSSFLRERRTAGASRDPQVWVRVSEGVPGHDDIQLAVRAAGALLAGIWVAGVSSIEELLAVDRAVAVAEMGASRPDRCVPICLVIGSAQGVLDARMLAEGPRVVRLVLAEAALRAQLGLDPTGEDGTSLVVARQMLVMASAAAGIARPLASGVLRGADGANGPAEDRPDRLAASCRQLRSAGFAGLATGEPSDVELINRVFAASVDPPTG